MSTGRRGEDGRGEEAEPEVERAITSRFGGAAAAAAAAAVAHHERQHDQQHSMAVSEELTASDFPVSAGRVYLNPLSPFYRAQLNFILVGWLSWFVFWRGEASDQLGNGRFCALIAAKNLAIGWAWIGGWHWFLYVQRAVPLEKKFNVAWPSEWQHRRDALFSTLGILQASVLELGVMALYARGAIPQLAVTLAQPASLAAAVAWVGILGIYADVHFYFAHRILHPWSGKQPLRAPAWDLGALLYKHCHSLHHKSSNPGPWSGLSMHPVEHAFYFSRCLVVLSPLVAVHPVHFLYVLTRLQLGPAKGHHGFDHEGGSSYSHYLHHAKLESNYGTNDLIPFDLWFNTRAF